MKIGATVAIGSTVAAAIAVAIYLKPPPDHPLPSTPSAAPSTLVEHSAGVRTPASSAEPRTPLTASIADLTRLTIQSLSSDDAKVREHAIRQLLPELAQRDPTAAARVADLFVDSSLRPQILSAVASG